MYALIALLGCPAETEDSDGLDVPTSGEFSDCDPLSEDFCGVPFPSTFYMREDSASPTGWRMHLGETTLPYTDQDDISYQPKPDMWNELDGASPLGPAITYFQDLSGAELVGHDDIGASIGDGASIVLLDWDTGERMPYFAELDVAGNHYDGWEMLFIRPVTPLRNGHRYVVGIRGLTDVAGAAVEPSAAFKALRDGTPTESWDVEGRRPEYEELFGKLEADGWSREDTLLAWDFVVKSEDAVAKKVLWMRDDAKIRIGENGPAYTIDSTEDNVDEHIGRRIIGTMTVPMYTETDEAPTRLTRDADGMPYYNGEVQRQFTIIVPNSVIADPKPSPMIQYGHGLLGSQGEVDSSYLGELADRYGYILFAADWTGMSEDDYNAVVLLILNEIDNFGALPEREQQGYIEFMSAAWLMKGAMTMDDALTFDGVNVVDPERMYYYGNSQGGILGGAYMALSQDFTLGCLGVGGMPYSLLLSRSADFDAYFALFMSVYEDQRDIAYWLVLMQQLWDPGEAGGFGRQMNEAPLADTPAKMVLIQDARGDAQVTNLGAHIQARSYGAVMIDPPVRDIWGVTTENSGYVGSAIVEFSFGAPEEPATDTPPSSDTDTHEDTRRAWAAQEQMHHFFESGGEVVNYCQGACTCETGACDQPVD